MDENQSIKILLIEDCHADCCLMEGMLKDPGAVRFEVETVNRLSTGLAQLAENKFDVLILDLGLPESSGMDTLKKILVHNLEVPIIVLTGRDDDQLGLEAIKEGAQDYLSKGQLDKNVLTRSIRYAIERHHLLAELHNQSLHDYLTGLNNRRGFFLLAQQHVKLAKRMRRPVLFVVADLDGMKKINDTFGHEAGDQALVETARVFKKTFRDADIIGRIGGDEFAVCIMEDDTLTAEAITARLEQNIGISNSETTSPFRLSISMGIARFDSPSQISFEQMLARADGLMYEKKRSRQQSSS
ncbi:MAG: diguanylate cyclase [Nitrospirae bacterium]|nr:diguanylate cyclase [Nitrospirota bacterium]